MNEKAKIVPLSELMGDNIGESPKEVAKQKSDEDLVKAIDGQEEKQNFFNLDDAKEKAEAEAKKAEESKEEGGKAEKKEETTVVAEDSKQPTIEETFNKSEPGTIVAEDAESDVYKKTLKSMFGDSIGSLIQEDEDGNEKEVSLEDITINEDLFQQIVQQKLDLIKEEASKDKISVKGVSDFAKKLIEIDRNGGDINELIKQKESYADPLDEIDFDTEEGQIQAVYLRLLAGGQDEDTIRRLIQSYKTEGSLAQKAQQAEQDLRGAVDQQLENARLAAEKSKTERKGLLKQYKKDLKENLSSFQLNDNIKNKIVTLATKEDDEGRFEMDRLYYQLRENPEKAARLALFLLDEDEYVKQVTNAVVQQKKLDSAGKLKIVMGSQKQTASPQLSGKSSKESTEDNILPLDRLANS
jgi:hypothetical protein